MLIFISEFVILNEEYTISPVIEFSTQIEFIPSPFTWMLKYPLFGLQFHPESIYTPEGIKMIKNFLKICNKF